MTNTSKTITFFGTDDFSSAALEALIGAGYTIGRVVTKPDSRQGRGHHLAAPAVKRIAETQGIPVWQPTHLSPEDPHWNDVRDSVGVLSSYGKIIPQAIIDLFKPGIINIHPSLLPKYRGPSPIESAIANGDTETGVSIMLLTAEMDAGPIYVQQSYPLDGTETQPELYERLAVFGSQLLVETLPRILDGSLVAEPQTGTASYSKLLTKADGLLDPAAVTADEAARKVRAHILFPKTKARIFGHDVIISQAHAAAEQVSTTDIKCQDGHFLVIDELIAPSGRRMTGQAFANGYTA